MERTISATEARVHFGEWMRRVAENNEAVIVERDGEAQVVIVSLKEYERFREETRKQSWLDSVRDLHELMAVELGGKNLRPAEDIIREMREERSRQFDDLR